MNTYSFDHGLEILKLIDSLKELCVEPNLKFEICKNSTCVNGYNEQDGSFILTPNYNTLFENLKDVYTWLNNEKKK